MKSPWQIWTVFGLCVAVVLAGMAWLSVRAIELDRAEAAARQRAEDGRRQLAVENRQVQIQQIETQLEKNIGQALWRMDSFMIPLLAQESFLPHFVYQSFNEAPEGLNEVAQARQSQSPAQPPSSTGNQKEPSQPQAKRLVPSPLLVSRSPYVKLHFQFDAKGNLSSPQAPPSRYKNAWRDNGIAQERIEQGWGNLREFEKLNLYAELAGNLPNETLPNNLPNPAALAYSVPNPYALQEEQSGSQQQELNSPAQQTGSVPSLNRQMRSNKNRGEYQTRNQSKAQFDQTAWVAQQIASNNYFNNDIQSKSGPLSNKAEEAVREGVSEPRWVGSTLVLARRVQLKEGEVIQGLEFDWKNLEKDLLADVEDLLPNAKLEPVQEGEETDEGRMLATLPVKLVVPPLAEGDLVPTLAPASVASNDTTTSPIWATLGVAWSGVLLASLAVGGLLLGVVRLSERRASFVSSVTHELRTPLTTFRMYAEMLAEGMVTSDDQRTTYLRTLTSEADRLTHLVDNVLTYSRIERGRDVAKRRPTTLGELIEQCKPRLEQRAHQADMTITTQFSDDDAGTVVETDPSVVDQILFNLVDNACKYAQSAEVRAIDISMVNDSHSPRIVVRDHGPGLSRDAAKRLFQPFSKSATEAAHSAPGVGLGLALSRRLARSLGGDLCCETADGGGAQFALVLPAGKKDLT